MSAVVIAGLGLACSDETGRGRDEAPASPAPVVPAPGSSGASAGTSAPPPPDAVAAAGSDGVAAGTPPLSVPALPAGMQRGEPLAFIAGTGDVPYAIGPNEYGISGGGFLARSALGNSITVGNEPGKICISGSLDEVPLNPDGHGNYGQYWGVEFGFNLNQVAADSTAADSTAADSTAADSTAAGLTAPAPTSGDAGAMDVAEPWHPGNVVGFSFVIEGPTIDLVRFKSLPDGYDSSLESSVFCKEIRAVSGTPNDALFSELSTFCWGGINTLIPTAAGLDNISWQLPADVAPIGARPFDWCLSDLRPILTAQP
jgi:hypothetical protein